MSLFVSLTGHLWTVGPKVRQALLPLEAPAGREWAVSLRQQTPGGRPVTLTGTWREVPGSRAALVLIHGLAGCTQSPYMLSTASAADAAGLSCLRLNLRGSDRKGADFYHAGLTDDLHGALGSPELAAYREIYVLGFSLGGHVALRAATEDLDPRVRAVAAVCSPLDLGPCAEAIDRPRRWPYRRYLLIHLMDLYRAVAERGPVPLPIEDAARIAHIQEWDERIVAPRHGFEGAADYYRRASVAPRLESLRVPALMVQSEGDPMVPAAAVKPVVEGRRLGLDIRWSGRGGHVGFPRDLDLGMAAPRGLEAQVVGWLQGAG